MQRFTLLLLLVVLYSFQLFGQLIYTEPFFPRLDDEVTIYFDATEGNAGLANCNCDIYLHTGVITNQSTSLGDWRNVQTTWGVANADWKLTPVAGRPNVYSYTISPSIREYYNIENGVVVEQMAFVFRNATGSLEGKEVGNTDIFVPVYPNNFTFTTQLLSPSTSNFIVEEGAQIRVWGVSSEEATLSIFDNGTLLAQSVGTALDYTIIAQTAGSHIITFVADNGTDTISKEFSYIAAPHLEPANPPAGVEPGLNVLSDTSVILALYAPGKNSVFAVGSFGDWLLKTDYQMRPDLAGELWWVQLNGLTTGVPYTYQYLVDGSLRIADPFSTLVLDPIHDGSIPAVTYPNLPHYPTGKTNGIVSVFQLGEAEYDWAVDDFVAPDPEELVIYELLIRDFIARHDYTTLIDTLDYLDNLGVNVIELMPVSEFEGNVSWGYNVSFHMALDKYYGTKNEFKRFVDSCHARGIAVVLDVVYNHAFGQSPLVQLYFENGKPTPGSPYFNPDATHPFNVGYDFNHESEATKFFLKKTVQYWLEEFRVDGFRFDLSKGFTQRNNPIDVGAWGRYDESRIAIWKDYADFIWSVKPETYVILEHFADNQEETELINYGMLVWGNNNYNYNEASMGYLSGSNLNGALHTSRGWTKKQLVSYMESHDEERLMYKNLEYGNSSGSYSVKNLQTALQRQELVGAFFYTLPGPKMLWQFGELGYEIPIDFNGRTGEKPIRWSYLNEPDRRRLHDVTSALLNLRRNYDVFQTDNFTANIGNTATKTIHLNDDEFDVTVLGNFDVTNRTVVPNFQSTGTWYDYFSGDSLIVTDVTAPLDFKPGEYRLYTSVRLPEPPTGYIVTSTAEVIPGAFDLSVSPNPVGEHVVIQYQLQTTSTVRIELFNNAGQLLEMITPQRQAAGLHTTSLPVNLPKGIYTLKLTAEGKAGVVQVVKM